MSRLNEPQTVALNWLRSHGDWVSFRLINKLGYKIASICKLQRMGLVEVRPVEIEVSGCYFYGYQEWRALPQEKQMSDGSVQVVLFGLANDLECNSEARRTAAMMWLEYAIDADTVQMATGMTQDRCIWIAHSLLQGPNYTDKDLETQWVNARDLTQRHCREAAQEADDLR